MPGAFSGMARRHWQRAGLAILAAFVLAVSGEAPALARKKPPAEEPKPALSLPKDLFGFGEIAHPPATGFAKWTETIARYERERSQERALCQKGDCALVRWREFLAPLMRKDAPAQLRAVNDYMNRVPYRADLENYGAEDYWATPREFFAKGGDCEDYALAKYLSLRALGWPAERLRIVVVHDNARDLVHAALIAYHEGNAYLLDIEIGQVTDHRNVARYVPIFAIGENGWWSYRPLAPAEIAQAVGKVAKLVPEWRSLLMRHKPGRAKALARPSLHHPVVAQHAKLAAAWRSPHMKHKPGHSGKAAPRPAEKEPTVAADVAPATAPAGERIEEMFLPGAQ